MSVEVLLVAACALIDTDGRFLMGLRARKWEFPYGKTEENERPEEAIIRELRVDNRGVSGLFAALQICLSPI